MKKGVGNIMLCYAGEDRRFVHIVIAQTPICSKVENTGAVQNPVKRTFQLPKAQSLKNPIFHFLHGWRNVSYFGA